MNRPEINQCALFVSSADKHPDEIVKRQCLYMGYIHNINISVV